MNKAIIKGILVISIFFSAYLTFAFAALPNPVSFKVYSNKDGKTPVAGVNMRAVAAGATVQSCTTDQTGACRFSHGDLLEQTYFVGEKGGVTYGGLSNPNYGCKKITLKYDTDAVYQYIDGIKGEALTNYAIFAESFYSTSCNVTSAPTGLSTRSSEIPPVPVPTPAPAPPQEVPSEPAAVPAGQPPASGDEFEDLIEEDVEPSDVDIVLVKTGSPIYGKPKRRPHTAPPDPKARYFQFTTTFDNTDSAPHKVFFYTACTAVNGPTVEIANMYGIHNLPPGKKRVKHTLPVSDAQLAFVEELKRSTAPITCVFTMEGLNDLPSVNGFTDPMPDSDSSNNVLSFTMAFGRNGKLRITSYN